MDYKIIKCFLSVDKLELRLLKSFVFYWLNFCVIWNFNWVIKIFYFFLIWIWKRYCFVLDFMIAISYILAYLTFLSNNYFLRDWTYSMRFTFDKRHKRMIRIIDFAPPGMLWLSHWVICPWCCSFNLFDLLLLIRIFVLIYILIRLLKQIISNLLDNIFVTLLSIFTISHISLLLYLWKCLFV